MPATDPTTDNAAPYPQDDIVRVTDAAGRVLGVRRPAILQRLRLIEAMGAANANNPRYMSFALLAAAVVEIDGEICAPIAGKRQLEARVQQLDEHGMDAAWDALRQTFERDTRPGAAAHGDRPAAG